MQGILMPSMATVDRVDIMGASWVLVVEKEVCPGVFLPLPYIN
jgi:hypothetical protein